MNSLRIVGVQMDLAWEDPAKNHARAEALLEAASPPVVGGELVVLPEMFATGFSMNPAVAAERAGGPTEAWARATARRFGVTLLAGWARRDVRGESANEAVAIDPNGELLTVYRKQRPFTPAGEGEHYVAGRRGEIFGWAGLTVAPFICYDLRFPELFRVAAQERPEVYVVIASWPEKRVSHWVKLLQARAIENQAYVVGVNRVGDDPVHHYNGHSLIVNPQGEILADAGDGERVISAGVEISALRDYRQRLPFLADLR